MFHRGSSAHRPRISALLLVALCFAPTLASATPLDIPGLHRGHVYHRVFVTAFNTFITSSSSFPPVPGEFGGLRGADWNINFAADRAGLTTNWNGKYLIYKAVLSDSSTSARDRLDIQGPIYNMANELVDAADLWDGSIAHAVRYTDLGTPVGIGRRAWTGTNPVGQVSGQCCIRKQCLLFSDV